MKALNIYEPEEWFKILQTTQKTQSAVMKLGSGQSTSNKPEAHQKSDQVLLLVDGELEAEIGGRHSKLKAGDMLTIAPGVKHRFVNSGDKSAVAFNVYSPPEYSADDGA